MARSFLKAAANKKPPPEADPPTAEAQCRQSPRAGGSVTEDAPAGADDSLETIAGALDKLIEQVERIGPPKGGH
jgi:hypothetical protein